MDSAVECSPQKCSSKKVGAHLPQSEFVGFRDFCIRNNVKPATAIRRLIRALVRGRIPADVVRP